jgi:3-hydroxyacyl-CoA dehydrogenase/enoyl-CoA hydratase/3-hydroxybutyryl-CoA epimerase
MTAGQSVSISRENGVSVAVDVRRDGVAFVWLDCASDDRALTPSFAAELSVAADRIERDATIAAAVLTGGAPARQGSGPVAWSNEEAIVLGATVDRLKRIKFATDAERLARDAAQLLRRLNALKKPLVAAVHGAAFGGAFELALACHALVATDDPKTTLGFPEVRLGLIPAANGMLRVARRAGVRTAIDLVVGGETLNVERGRALGLIDDVCPLPIVLEVAARRAKALVGNLPPTHLEEFDVLALLERSPLCRALLFRRARHRSHAETRGHYPAPARALNVLECYARNGFDAASELEAKAFGELVVSETAHRLMDLHCATVALKRSSVGDDWNGPKHGVEARNVERVSVVGGGSMGSGIAFACLRAGSSVRLKEMDDASAGRALKAVSGLLDARVAEGRCTSLERSRVFARISATTDYAGLRHADLVVEAVFEDAALKMKIVCDVEPLVSPTCVLASSTSSIPIATIAQAAKRPERVLGMHYLGPVTEMGLLEVVRAEKTESWAVATAVALGRRQKKTVIVVKDSPGFYTTRILVPWLHEAAHLLGEGLTVEAIDQAMTDWGFPGGPLQLLDEVGIDVAARVAQLLLEAFGERMTPPRSIAKFVADERLGRKT